jgi:hypothetical protein
MTEVKGWYDDSPSNPRRLQRLNGYPAAKAYADQALVQLRRARDLERSVRALAQKQTYLFSQIGIDLAVMEAKLHKEPSVVGLRPGTVGNGGKE